jgi:hypothetical protein
LRSSRATISPQLKPSKIRQNKYFSRVLWDSRKLTFEQILVGENVTWGKAIVTQEWSESVPGNRRGGTPGFVVLSEAGNLPWGEKCERGDIYTWDRITRWDCKAGCYLLSFTIKEK